MASAWPVPSERRMLDLWERGVALGRWRREDALIGGEGPAPSGLGARNRALLGVRNALFGAGWPLRSRCPDCGEDCAFDIDTRMLAEGLGGDPPATSATVDWAGCPVQARAPTVEDLRAIAHHRDRDTAVRALLARCLADAPGIADADEAAVAAVADALERLDPAAVVGFALACPACDHRWTATVDVGATLWSEVQRAAEDMLIEVDALARAYGWSEAEVLRLSPVRRAAYIQLAQAT